MRRIRFLNDLVAAFERGVWDGTGFRDSTVLDLVRFCLRFRRVRRALGCCGAETYWLYAVGNERG